MKIKKSELAALIRRAINEIRIEDGSNTLTGAESAAEIQRMFNRSTTRNMTWTAEFIPSKQGSSIQLPSAEGSVKVTTELPMSFTFYIGQDIDNSYHVSVYYGSGEFEKKAIPSEKGLSFNEVEEFIKKVKAVVAEIATKRITAGIGAFDSIN